jgi:competence ComEA-like helix-hairpin-helix protein
MRGYLNAIKKICLLSALSFAGVLAGLSQPASQEGREPASLPEGAQYLPEGEGRAIMLKACVQCHDLRNTVSQRKTEAGWRRTVNEMVWRGTPLVGDEAETVTRYLAKSFGPDKSSPGLVKKIFGGDGREKARPAPEMDSTLVNINTAAMEELMTLPGIGTAEARAILESRRKNGDFKSVDDLDRVKGIPQSVKAAIKKRVTVERARPRGGEK